MNTKFYLLVAVCLTLLFSESVLASNRGTKNPALENILTRTSVRSYDNSRAISQDTIELLLRAAMSAPTAVNKQPWAFVVINDKNTLDRLVQEHPHGKMYANAPLVIVTCGDLSKTLEGDGRNYWIQDVSAATENLLLAAHSLGLGAVWTGCYPSEARSKAIARVLNLPETIIPLAVVPIGYPTETPIPKDKWNAENVHYNSWD